MKTLGTMVLGAVAGLLMQASLSSNAAAQARLTADKRADVSVFAGGSSVDADYGSDRQMGYLFGADYTRFMHFFLAPSVEVRGSISPIGDAVGENVFSGGLKLQHTFRRYQPYADFLIGYGSIKFAPSLRYVADSSVVYTYGGGVDIYALRHFSVKLDLQTSNWNTGENVTYSPNAVSVGVVYHIPFGSRYSE